MTVKRPLFIFLGIFLILVGLGSIYTSTVATAKGKVSNAELQCTPILIGSACSGGVHRGGGGMCWYNNVSFYTIAPQPSLEARNVEIYLPFTTCSTSAEVFGPTVDLVVARFLSAISVVAGIVLIILAFRHSKTSSNLL